MQVTASSDGSFISNMFSSAFISNLFDYLYIALIVMAIIISLTTPVDRGISYFKFLMAFFGILLLITMAGIIYYLIEQGLFPTVKHYNSDLNIWYEDPDVRYFSVLVLAGIIMCMVFLIPMILRPLDFL